MSNEPPIPIDGAQAGTNLVAFWDMSIQTNSCNFCTFKYEITSPTSTKANALLPHVYLI